MKRLSAMVQGANFAKPGTLLSFGAFAADVLPAAAQAVAQANVAPAPGKNWAKLQLHCRWTVTPPAPAEGTPDAIAVLYWGTAAAWFVLGRWLLKEITTAMSLDDKRAFSNFNELPCPGYATRFAVGVENYVGGTFYIDMGGVG